MNLSEKFEVLIITLSDRAHKGEYEDLSGPRIREILSGYLSSQNWEYSVNLTLMPDNAEMLRELLKSAGSIYNIIITSGGTGISPGILRLKLSYLFSQKKSRELWNLSGSNMVR